MDKITNLSIISAQTNSAGQRICTVNPSAPLYIKELIIVPYPTPTPIGVLKPGTPDNLAVRTIFVDPHDPVLTASAPFTLAVTYDDQTFRLTAPLRVLLGTTVAALFNFAPAANLSPEDAAIFVTEALAAAAPQLNPPQAGAGISALGATPQAQQKHSSAVHKNGEEKTQHAKSS